MITRREGAIGSVGVPTEERLEDPVVQTRSSGSVAVPDSGDSYEDMTDETLVALHLCNWTPGASVDEKVAFIAGMNGATLSAKAAVVRPYASDGAKVKSRPNKYDFWRGIEAVWKFDNEVDAEEVAENVGSTDGETE